MQNINIQKEIKRQINLRMIIISTIINIDNKSNKTERSNMGKEKVLYSWLFTSRNKDNKNVKEFQQRRMAMLAYVEDKECSVSVPDKVMHRFKQFVADGKKGETCRLYRSINSFDEEKVRKQLASHLILEDISLPKLEATSVSIASASKNHCANQKKWLLDFDSKNKDRLNDLLQTIEPLCGDMGTYKTPNGYAVVIEHGFDTRTVLEPFADILTVKKDAFLFVCMAKSKGIAVDDCIDIL